MVKLTCRACGAGFEAQRSTARYCSAACRMRVHRAGGNVPAPPVVPVVGDSGDVSVGAAVRRELEELGALDTADSALALSLARRIDSDSETGTAIASLSRQLSQALDRARRSAPRPASKLDEIRARRDARIAEAAARRGAQ